MPNCCKFIERMLKNGANVNSIMTCEVGDSIHDTINSLLVLLKQDISKDGNRECVDRCKYLNQIDTFNLLLD